MNSKWKMLGLTIVLAGVAMLHVAKADDSNKETAVTLSAPLAVPGDTLPPGNYVFQLDGQSNPNVVQIFNGDKTRIVARIPAILAYRLEPSEATLITFEEGLEGSPEALSRWFFPGELQGVGFLYPPNQR